jgi:hypothetical protein
MGFHTSRKAETPPSILIIAVVQVSGTGAAVKSVAGADAVLLRAKTGGLTASALQKMVKPLKETPWGVLGEESADNAAALTGAGCDFLVFTPASSVAATPQDEKTGKILQVESAMDDGLLRAVNDLPADALLLTDTFDEGGGLVWHQLMIFRHLKSFIAKPLLVPVPAAISEADLKALRDAGIDGIVAEAAGGDLKELRDMAAKLPPRAAPKRGKVDVILPRASTPIAASPDEEEEDE